MEHASGDGCTICFEVTGGLGGDTGSCPPTSAGEWNDPQDGGSWACRVDPPAPCLPIGTWEWTAPATPGTPPYVSLKHTLVVV